MQLLTVLGTGHYKPTCYTWQDKEYETEYVAEALKEFFKPDKISVLVTTEAKEKHWDKIKPRLGDIATDILIPSGKTEAEVWQIFDEVVKIVEPNTQVIFDITHAFRSIPFLVLLASAFLQKAKGVTIQGVYYGAFEINNTKPPIFNLTPAVKLLDWLTATEQFISTGSSVELGKLLRTIQDEFYTKNKPKKNEAKPTTLIKFGEAIQKISHAIELVRPIDLIKETNKLEKISFSKLEDEVGTFAKPFGLLLNRIQEDYKQFSLSKAEHTPKEELQKQFLLLRWYVAKEMSLQAILLAREWVVSVLCLAEAMTNYQDKEERKNIEHQLGSMIQYPNPNLEQPIVTHVSSAKKLSGVWSKLTRYRNDLAHVQMNIDPIDAETLQKFTTEQLLQDLSDLFPEWVI